MAIKGGNIAITGTADGISGYFSHGFNIIRHANYLSRIRVKDDPAFQCFRKRSNWMKEASRIAALPYNQIPKAQ